MKRSRRVSSGAKAKKGRGAAKTRDALKILEAVTGDDPETLDLIARERVNVRVAMLIYEARTAAGLTQKRLAELVGTKQPVISQLENADYEGHSLSMLQRIADALGKRIHIALVRAA